MKQLKIVVDEIDTANPFFTANFTETITISPDSRIWFDKISFNIISSGGDGSIQLGEQILQIAPNVITGPLSQGYRSIYLAPATYTNIDALYVALQTAMNGCLNSKPSNPIGNKMPDVGLSFLANPSETNPTQTELAFVQSECIRQTNPISSNINLGAYWWTPTVPQGATPWQLTYPTPILAGALQCNSAVYFPSLVDYTGNECFIGLYTQTGIGPIYDYVRAFGFLLTDDGTWHYYNNETLSEIGAQALFQSANDPPTTLMSWWVEPNDEAHLKCGLFDVGTNPQVPAELLVSPNLTFEGYDVNRNYYFGADGTRNGATLPVQILDPYITYQPNIVQEHVGWRLNTGDSLNKNYKGLEQRSWGNYAPYPELSVIGPRNVSISFRTAQSLMQGLGFTNIINYLVGTSGSIIGSNPVGFVNFFDLALDCYNFTLDSYMSSPHTKGRVSAIAYFVPVPTSSISGQTMFYAENKQLTFIDIRNKVPQTVETLNFRLYNPQNPMQTFLLSNVSFTLFIEGGNDKEDGLLVRLA